MPIPSTFGQDPRRGILGLLMLNALMRARHGGQSLLPSAAGSSQAITTGDTPTGTASNAGLFSSIARLFGGQALKQGIGSIPAALAGPAPGALTLSLGGAAPSGGAEVAAALGAEGLGDVGAGGAVTSLGDLAGAFAFPLIAGNIIGSITGRGIFGGNNPRDAQRKAAEVTRNVSAAFPALRSDLQIAATQGDVQQAIDNFTFRVADTGFGLGFAEGHGAGRQFEGFLPTPPGGQFDALVSRFQPVIRQMFQSLPKGPAGRVSNFGAAVNAEREGARQAKHRDMLANVFSRTGIPPETVQQTLAAGGSIAGADTADPVVWSDRGRVFAPGFGEGGG